MATEALQQAPKDFLLTTFQRRLAVREGQAGILPRIELTPEQRPQQLDRLDRMIGNTPLVRMEGPNNSIFLVKYESQNPTESHYDRVYIKTIRTLEEQGVIEPGDELYEVTSGSAGVSFAWLCDRLGYQANIFVPKSIPEARKQEMINFGANLVEEDGYVGEASKEEWKQFTHLARDRKRKLRKVETDDFSVIVAEGDGKRMCLMNHSENPMTPKALESIADEVGAVIPRGVGLDYFVSVLGNGSNTVGVTSGLKRRFNGTQIIGVEDWDTPAQFEQKFPGEYERRFEHAPSYREVQMFGSGTKTTARLRFIDAAREMVDDIYLAPHTLWNEKMRIFNSGKPPAETIGASTAGSLIVAEQLAREHPGINVLLIAYDKGDRYGSPIVPDTTPTMSLYEAAIAQTQRMNEDRNIPPVRWQQWFAESPLDLPDSLHQSYKSPEIVLKENLAKARIK